MTYIETRHIWTKKGESFHLFFTVAIMYSIFCLSVRGRVPWTALPPSLLCRARLCGFKTLLISYRFSFFFCLIAKAAAVTVTESAAIHAVLELWPRNGF